MAEKSTLVEKLPPLAKAESPVAAAPTPPPAKPVVKTPIKPVAPVAKTNEKADTKTVASKPVAEKKEEPVAAVTVEETTPPAQVTATATEYATYYSFLGDAVIWGCMGLFLFGKAFKDKKKVRFVSMATYGGLLIAIAFMFFIYSKTYASFLRGETGQPTLAMRGFCWAVFAPVLFYILSRVIKVPAQDKKLYLTMFGLGSGIFLFIGLSNLVSGRLEQLGLSVFPFLFSGSLTLLLFYTLGRGASALQGKLKQGVSVIVFVIIGGWFLYPVINLLSHLTNSITLFSLALNLVDLVLLSGITFGLWESVSTRTDRILFKPSFGKAKRASASPFTDRVPAGAPAVTAKVSRGLDGKDSSASGSSDVDDGKAKPAFKRPKNFTNN
ncbi:bacteriorhodopsin [Cerasicoccus arenae]|uniref:Uncharacterized protein n=1 Tax=Cerasicoccus arenae TaxID=424488 RepID=A0A8J3DAR0_9BACT|nr:bacteriorhodopsin [Cerasicoccus arenae]MBK1859550.1 bacteriorhodopsin [Cerasicoccus arenae]GHC03192.1 hypothetical protein GCM10007047_19690 [Cerasicoccus arenae]